MNVGRLAGPAVESRPLIPAGKDVAKSATSKAVPVPEQLLIRFDLAEEARSNRAFSAETARILRALVRREQPLFAAFRDLDIDDLVSEATLAVRKATPHFDPARGAWSTFVWRVAHRRLIDLYRSRARQAKRETQHVIEAMAREGLEPPE